MKTPDKIFLDQEIKKQFRIDHGKEFILNGQTDIWLRTIADYFSKNDRFIESPLLQKKLSIPSLDKGLLIIGDYGVGKTHTLTSAINVLNRISPSKIKIHLAKEVVTDYESLEFPNDKKQFNSIHSRGYKFYDDILSEDIANNYGRKNVFKDIIEVREFQKAKTILTCNFDAKFPRDIDKALDQFHKKYDGRVYDRLFSMFNIIELQGKSMRE